jgi:hypothetical protein
VTWKRLSATILQIGAVATALTAVVGLVVLVWPDSETPPKRGAKLSNVQVREHVTLAEFAARHRNAAAAPDLSPEYRLVSAVAQATPPEMGGDADGDGKPDTLDACPRDHAQTEDGCPPAEGDRDDDGKPDTEDKCPDQAGHLQNGCPLDLRRRPRDVIDTIEDEFHLGGDCPVEQLEGGVRRAACSLLSTPSGGDANARAAAILDALNGTRTIDGPGEKREPLGVEVSFDVTLEGYAGRRAEVSWSLYQADGKRLPQEWLADRKVLVLKGEAIEDGGGDDFWVPLPKRPSGPYYVRITVSGDNGSRLTFEDTEPFG